MPLDFPSNPSDGQVSGNYVWSSASGAWKSIPTSKTVSTISSAAPTSATAGDIWIDSNDGSSYYYFDDGTSRQWVELIASGIPATPVSVATGGTGATTALGAKTNLQIPLSHNYLINGAFDVWQRGDTVSQSSKCGADQWYYYYYFAMSQIRTSSGVPVGSTNAMRVRSDANGNLVVGVMQVLDNKNAMRLWGKQVTFSVKLRRISTMIQPIQLLVYKHANVDQSPASGTWTNIGSVSIPNASIPTGTTSADWYTASITVTIPSDGTANTLWFEVRASGGMDNGVYYEVAEAQVEEGSIATAFKRNQSSFQAELDTCQKYYYRMNAFGTGGYPLLHGSSVSTSVVEFNVLKQMRAAVTALDSANIGIYRLAGQSVAPSGPTIYASTSTNTFIRFTGTAGMFTATPENVTVYATGNPAYLGFSAEL